MILASLFFRVWYLIVKLFFMPQQQQQQQQSEVLVPNHQSRGLPFQYWVAAKKGLLPILSGPIVIHRAKPSSVYGDTGISNG